MTAALGGGFQETLSMISGLDHSDLAVALIDATCDCDPDGDLVEASKDVSA